MIQMWLGFSMPEFPGSGWVAPFLGTFVFLWGGWPFLKGGFEEAREWRPEMRLLLGCFRASADEPLGSATQEDATAGARDRQIQQHRCLPQGFPPFAIDRSLVHAARRR